MIAQYEDFTVYFNQILLNDGLPFEIEVPNQETKKAIADSRNKANLTKADNADEMFQKLGI